MRAKYKPSPLFTDETKDACQHSPVSRAAIDSKDQRQISWSLARYQAQSNFRRLGI